MESTDLPVTPGTLSPTEIRELVAKEDPLIIEVGANCGQTTVELMRAMPGARLFAFEPDPRAIAKFRRNVAHPRVELFECAVGASNGSSVFYQSSGAEDDPQYPEGWDQSGSIRRPRSHLEIWPWVRFERQIEVPITTLDAWAQRQRVSAVDFIWADVQGAESDLVAGAANVLRATRYLYTEYSDDEWYEGQIGLHGLQRMLQDFELIRRYPMDALFRRRPG